MIHCNTKPHKISIKTPTSTNKTLLLYVYNLNKNYYSIFSPFCPTRKTKSLNKIPLWKILQRTICKWTFLVSTLVEKKNRTHAIITCLSTFWSSILINLSIKTKKYPLWKTYNFPIKLKSSAIHWWWNFLKSKRFVHKTYHHLNWRFLFDRKIKTFHFTIQVIIIYFRGQSFLMFLKLVRENIYHNPIANYGVYWT